MAGEIFVGSVAVGVVPDLRHFNQRIRADLVPSANSIGREIGQNISRGIMESLDMGKIITESSAKAYAATRRAGYELGLAYGKAMRRGIELALDGITAKVRVEADTTLARAEIARLSGTVTERIRTTGGGTAAARAVAGLGGGGRDVGALGGISALLKSLPGGTSGSIAAVPAAVGVPAGLATLAATPFIAQILAGAVPAVFGGGLAGLGIAGAFGAGQVPQAQVDRAKGLFDAATLRVTAAQERLNRLRASGKASTDTLARAEASLAGAQNSASAAQIKYQDAQKSRMTSGQEAVRAAFENLAVDAKTSLGTIGLSFVPVMQSVLHTADSIIKKVTPIFAGAVKTIAGPFEVFSNTIIKTFASPQVESSIQAVAQAFADVMTAFTPDIPGIMNSLADAIERISHAVSRNPKAFADFLNFFFQLIIVILDGIAALTNFADYVEQHFMPAVQHFVNFWIIIWNTVSGAVDAAWHAIQSTLDALSGFLSRSLNNIIGFFKGAGNAIIAPFRALANWISSWFDPWWASNGEAIKRIWGAVWRAVVYMARELFRPVVIIVGAVFASIRSTFNNGATYIALKWGELWKGVSSVVHALWGPIAGFVQFVWNSIMHSFSSGKDFVLGIWRTLWTIVKNILDIAWAGIKSTIKIGWDTIIGVFTVSINLLTGRWGAAWNAMKNIVVQIWNEIRGFLVSAAQGLWNIFSEVFSRILNGAATAFGWVPGIGGKLRDAANQFNSFRDNVNNSLAGIRDRTVNVSVQMTSASNPYPGGITGRAQHGLRIPGFGGGDRFPIMVEGGELVLPKEAAADPMAGMLAGAYGVPGYASGGIALNLPSLSQFGKNMWTRISGSAVAAFSGSGRFFKDVIRIIIQALPGLLFEAASALSEFSPQLMKGMGFAAGGVVPYGGYSVPQHPPSWNAASQMGSMASMTGGGPTYVAHFDSLTGQAIEGHVRTAYQAMSLTQGNLQRQGRRQLWPTHQLHSKLIT